MEILQSVWKILITEDEFVTKIICFPFAFIEVYVTMRFLASILRIDYTTKQRNLFFTFMSIFSLLCVYVLPKSVSVYINLLVLPTITMLVFRISLFKSIVAEIATMVSTVLLEILYLNICRYLLGFNPDTCINTPLFRVLFAIANYSTLYTISRLIKKIKLDFSNFDKINSKNKRLIFCNLLFVIIYIALQFYLFIFYGNNFPIYIPILSLLSLVIYTTLSIYTIFKVINLEVTEQNLEQTKLHNKTLEILYNNMSGFRHDFGNIITALGGFINAKDISGLEKYYDKILTECHITNNLSALNPAIINNPAIYNILASKCYKADELDISLSLDIFINLNELEMDTYEFCRVLGILLDNAIEAASQCNEKIILLSMHWIKSQNYQILRIDNTYSNKDIDINKLFEKNYTTKKEDKSSHGLGLWQVNKILKKRKNVVLLTSKDEHYFTQELKIFTVGQKKKVDSTNICSHP